MYFILYLAHPKPSHAEYGVTDGAYVSCWIDDPVEPSADAAARALIEAAGWDVHDREEAYPVAEGHYTPGDVGAERVAQARLDGICATFHRWAVGAPEA